MPTQDEIMRQIVELVSMGAGGALSPETEAALRDRYFNWIGEVKKGNSTSPQDIWDSADGKKMQEQIKAIGKHLGKKPYFGKDDCVAACHEVEVNSACPHCPEPPGG
jgi:hypothetical protein